MTDHIYLVGITKPEFIYDIILLILFSLVFVFLSFVLYKVNKAQ